MNISSFNILSINVQARSSIQRRFLPLREGLVYGATSTISQNTSTKLLQCHLLHTGEGFLWEQQHAGSIGTHPFPYLTADALRSVDLSVRVV